MPNLTLLDLAARSGSDAIIGLIEDVTTYAPEFRVVAAKPKAGTTYKLTRRTALPTPAFRDANPASVGSTKSTYVQDLKEMYFLDCQLEVLPDKEAGKPAGAMPETPPTGSPSSSTPSAELETPPASDTSSGNSLSSEPSNTSTPPTPQTENDAAGRSRIWEEEPDPSPTSPENVIPLP